MARNKEFNESEALAKAIQLFWHKGYNGTSVHDLTEVLGIGKSSLYGTYTDKHTLFMKALASYQKTSSAQIQEVIVNSETARENIKRLMEFIVGEMLRDKQQKGCFLVNSEVEIAPHDNEVKDVVCKNDQEMEESLYQLIKKGQNSGEIKNPQDASDLARFILNSIQGMRVTAKITSDKVFFNSIIKLTLSILE